MRQIDDADTSRWPVPDGMDPAEWEVRIDLAACYRLVAHFGWTDLVYTHISARVPNSDHHYLLNPFGLAFEEITASNLIKIDLDGNKVDDSPHPVHRAGFVIHSAVHAARPDANCVMHLHTRAGMAVSALEEGLLPLTQHAMLFTGRVGYHASEGLAVDLDERERIARDLGDNDVLILRNHGTLVVGHSIGQAFSKMWHLEKACQAQMDILAAGRPYTVPSREVAEQVARRGFHKGPTSEHRGAISPLGNLEWPALRRLADRLDPGYRL